MFVVPLNSYFWLAMLLYQRLMFKIAHIKSFDFDIRDKSGRHLVTLSLSTPTPGVFL